MKNIPSKIYLQIADDSVSDWELKNAEFDDSQVTWCVDRIFKHDLVYFRSKKAYTKGFNDGYSKGFKSGQEHIPDKTID